MIQFRAAHRSEAAAIAGLSRLQVEYGLRWRWTPARIRSKIDDPDTMVLVASEGGAIIGFAVMAFGDDSAHLLLLAVDPAKRRRGVGRALVEWLEKSCRTAGIRRVQLEVRSGNRSARRFYHALGYRYLGQLPAYYDNKESATILGKHFTESDHALDSAAD